MKTQNVSPSAAILIESMRDIGYSIETALADLVDNSITSGASKIDILVDPSEKTARIGVLDNGRGMTQDELFTAMRPGSRSPLDERDATDLGRFGLGLKTASFSQCRRLTVVTRRDRETCAAIWDLTFVATKNEWLVQVPLAREIAKIPWAEHLGENGTLVLWEDLDRLHDGASKDAQTQLTSAVDSASEHVELVFHRFLAGEHGLPKVTIALNQRALKPFDPFHSSHPATIIGPVEHIKHGRLTVSVQSFTLQHHRKVTPAEWDRCAGRAGYLKSQGFYVYRGKRLIIWGTWFGLARQMELTKLARVRIDIPNRLDAAWKIDVKKASAHPPYQVRERLKRIIEPIVGNSKRVYTSRGQVRVTDSRLPVWNRLQNKNEIHYRLNPDHPVIESFRNRLPDHLKGEFARIMELAGSTLPVDALFADLGDSPEKITGTAISDETLCHAVALTVERLCESGRSTDEIKDMLRFAEPFRSNWDRTKCHLGQLWQAKEGANLG
jgi:hypothetical protein